MTIEQCEVPPSYSGDTLGAIAQVQATGSLTVTATFPASFQASLVSKGDTIQFDFQGPLYTITSSVSVTSGTASLTATCVNQGQTALAGGHVSIIRYGAVLHFPFAREERRRAAAIARRYCR